MHSSATIDTLAARSYSDCTETPMTWILYRHFKGQLYLGLGTALHSETKEPHAVYRCLYENDLGSNWVRLREMFDGTCDQGGPRFAPIARMRIVEPEENPIVLAFGYDVWSDGEDINLFIARYDDNPNHLRGTRYLLETFDGTILCNLNTRRFRRGVMGIASVATAPEFRKQGWASLLLRAVMELMRHQNGAPVRFLLFSEVDPAFYRKFGFAELPDHQQHFKPSLAMSTGELPLPDEDAKFVEQYF
jgi:hypothetical protein